MTAANTPAVHRELVACRAIELAMAALYETLADLHAHDPSMTRLWRKTAREEDNHAAQFSMLIDAIPDTVQATALDEQALRVLCSSVEAVTEEFRRCPPSVYDALVAAIDFEVAMDRIHAHQALVFTDPRHQRMFVAMMAADAGHVAELRRALSNL
jgi:rubrerythrin